MVQPPDLLLRWWNVRYASDADKEVYQPRDNEVAVTRLSLVLELKRRDSVVEGVGERKKPPLLCLDVAIVLKARSAS